MILSSVTNDPTETTIFGLSSLLTGPEIARQRNGDEPAADRANQYAKMAAGRCATTGGLLTALGLITRSAPHTVGAELRQREERST